MFFATTRQFPHWVAGHAHRGGMFPATLAGHHVHIATPTHIVSVGVAYIRKLFAAELIPSIHPAPRR